MSTLILDYPNVARSKPGAMLWAVLKSWRQRACQRHQLAELDDRQLADIGVSRTQALRESAKPFWQP